MKLRVGIFFGGPSRERELSFIGGRTVYDNLNQSLFEPVPIFVDSYRNFIALDWQHLHKNAIQDFYPPVSYRPASANQFPIYIESLGKLPIDEQDLLVRKIGRTIPARLLATEIDLAFVALPSKLGEDSLLQSLLEEQNIPYTGSGPEATQTCLDEAMEKRWMAENNYNVPPGAIIKRKNWNSESAESYFQAAVTQLGFPLTVRPAHYNLGIGYTILKEEDGLTEFIQALNKAFFRKKLTLGQWENYTQAEKLSFIRNQTDLQSGLGFPIDIHFKGHVATVSHPERLLAYLNNTDGQAEDMFVLESQMPESKVIVEKAVEGQTFSCIVIKNETGSTVSLLPMSATHDDVFSATEDQLHSIRQDCERLFDELALQAFAQIDGVLTADGEIFWKNIDTTPDMLPESHLFQQAATLGLTPTQLLTYLIQISLWERGKTEKNAEKSNALLSRLEDLFDQERIKERSKKRIAVVLGGEHTEEIQQSLESSRNIFEKLASSEKYAPFPVYMAATESNFKLYSISPSLLLLKGADALKKQIEDHQPRPEVEDIQLRCAEIISKYGRKTLQLNPQELSPMALKGKADAFFITLHGSSSANGHLQREFESLEMPYTGSNALSSAILFSRHRTLDTLKKNGMRTTELLLLKKSAYEADAKEMFSRIGSRFSYPFIGKATTAKEDPAAKVIQDRAQMEAYARLLFRPQEQEGLEARHQLQLAPDEEIPRSKNFVVEAITPSSGSKQTVPIKAGLFTEFTTNNDIIYDILEPTEITPGEQANITPARLGTNRNEYNRIIWQVKSVFEKAARILNIQGYAVIEAIVRIDEHQQAETIITNLQALPPLNAGNDFFQQAALNNYQPLNLFDQIITFALQRQALATGIPLINKIQEEMPLPVSSDPDPEEEKEPIIPPPTPPSQKQQPLSYAAKPPTTNSGLWSAAKKRLSSFFKELWRFMTSPIFIRNIGGLILMLIVLYWLLQVWLRFYTHHSQTLQVDDYTGMRVEDAMRKAKRNSFSVVLMDSFFMVDRPVGIVLEQEPKPFDRVKENRTIYLIVTKEEADEVSLPSLVGNYDYYQYARQLQRLNVRTKIRDKTFSSKLEENTILHLFIDDQKITEKDLKQGIKVPMGSVVEFVITQRNTGMVAVPSLVCKKYDAAAFLITSMNLNIGNIYGDVPNRDNAYVYKQEPAYSPGVNIPMSTTINVYLTSTRPSGCDGE